MCALVAQGGPLQRDLRCWQKRRQSRSPSTKTVKATHTWSISSRTQRANSQPWIFLCVGWSTVSITDSLHRQSVSPKYSRVPHQNVLNYENFLRLSEEAQETLCALLPPTAFNNYLPSLDPSHPAMLRRKESKTDVDQLVGTDPLPATLDPSFFNNPFFLSGAKTFQDHVFSSWLTKTARELVLQYEQGVRDGNLHAEWKDEEWQRDHPATQSKSQ